MDGVRILLGLIAAMWVVAGINLLTGHSLNGFALMPRTANGLIGIATAPFLHAGFAHLASNTGGLLVLGGLVALGGQRRFLVTSVALALGSGALVWVFGRSALHLGASGLVFGYFGVLVGRAWYERSGLALAAGAVALVLYGGLLWGILPLQAYVSWEGHLAGLLTGLYVARAGHATPAGGTLSG